MSVNQAEIHRLSLSESIGNRLEAVNQFQSMFKYLNDKPQVWADLQRLTCDENSNIRINAVESLISIFSSASDEYKYQVIADLQKLTNDDNSYVRWKAVKTLGYLFPFVPDEYKPQAWNYLQRLTSDQNLDVRMEAVESLISIFPATPGEYKPQAWDDVQRLISDENSYVRMKVAKSLGFVFSSVPDEYKSQVRVDLQKLTCDKNPDVRGEAVKSFNCLFSNDSKDTIERKKKQKFAEVEPEKVKASTFSSNLNTNQNEKHETLDIVEELKRMHSGSSFNSSEPSAIPDSEIIKNLIAQFQKAIEQEIETISKGTNEQSIKLTMGELVASSSDHFVYRFLLAKSITLPDDTPLDVLVTGNKYNGHIVSVDTEGINIGLDVNLGEVIQSATIFIQYSKLLEILHGRFESVKSGDFNLNLVGCMKLFGSHDTKLLSEPIQKQIDLSKYTYHPNDEQKQAIIKSLSQEVTFVWGPPGTGKTRVLSIILDQFVQANKKVLLVSHTNLAVDEILLKYLDIPESNEHVKSGKIIRHGTPAKKDHRLDALLIENIIKTKEKEKIEEIKSLEKTSKGYRTIIKNLGDKKLNDITISLNQITKNKSEVEEHISKTLNSITASEKKISKLYAKIDEDKLSIEKLEKAGIIKKLLAGSSKKKIIEDIALKEIEIESEKQKLNQLKLELNNIKIKNQEMANHCDNIKSQLTKRYAELQIPSSTVLSSEQITRAKNSLMEKIRDNDARIDKINQEIQLSKEFIFPNALVVGCTLTKAYIDSKLLNTKFDVMVLDEASMAQLPAVFFIAGIIEKSHYVVAGDFRQLSPIASSESLEARMWLKRDIFAQAGIEENVNNDIADKRLVMLREQYRMHESIANLINNAMYKGKLITSETTIKEKNRISTLSPFKNHALCLVNTSSVNPWCKMTSFGSRINIYSAFLSVLLAKEALNGGIKTIGIITPYNAQAKLINSFLEEKDLHSKGIITATIHKFQGNEKECIIFDPVDSPPYRKGQILSGTYPKSEAGKLINVAISRAEGKFVLVANREYVHQNFEADDALSCLLNDIEKSGESMDSKDILPSYFDKDIEKRLYSKEGMNLGEDKNLTIYTEKNFYKIFKHELLLAEKSVVIFSPFIARKRVSEVDDIFRILVEKGIKIYVITRSPVHQGNQSDVDTELMINELKKIGVTVVIASEKVKLHNKLHEKLALIDDHVCFIGSLNILSQSDSSEMMIPIRSKKSINNLIKYMNIDKIIQMYEIPQMRKNGNDKQNRNENSFGIIDKIELSLKNENQIGNCPNCHSPFTLMSDKENLYWCCPVDLKNGFDIRRNVPKHLIESTVRNLKIPCTKCNNGHLRYMVGKYGPFLSCDQYPACRNTLNLK